MLVGVFAKLRFEDDSEHGLAVDEQHHGVGAVLGRNEVVERRFGETGRGERRHGNVQELAQHIGGERGLLTHQGDNAFVKQRWHGANRSF
jgi:hypothetical protein